jgi:hypothetical protein
MGPLLFFGPVLSWVPGSGPWQGSPPGWALTNLAFCAEAKT